MIGQSDRLMWKQALAWRMQRHRLVDRVAPSELVDVVAAICGLHAQLMSSAELSLWARIEGLERGALQHALWEQRSLVKLWAMRGTLHVLPSAELGVWLAALSTYTNRGMTGHPEIDVLTGVEQLFESLLRLLAQPVVGDAVVDAEHGARPAEASAPSELAHPLRITVSGAEPIGTGQGATRLPSTG